MVSCLHYALTHFRLSNRAPQTSTPPQDSITILTNPEIIAINQDTVIRGPLKPFFLGKHRSHMRSVCFAVPPFCLALDMHIIATDERYAARDLWKHQDKGVYGNLFLDGSISIHTVRANILMEQP
ncbi:hypothetical protein Hypma_015915 [Hypsizygus marmoreus]|uniref:Uncharacterized protein n=1 Tax=Hypsizygus marmoreus TaxID=39966 RepID=A0A369K7M2_HYPMA|nr:hypothetical protein Hypma_015915 [Hypsizygus marmoreus]